MRGAGSMCSARCSRASRCSRSFALLSAKLQPPAGQCECRLCGGGRDRPRRRALHHDDLQPGGGDRELDRSQRRRPQPRGRHGRGRWSRSHARRSRGCRRSRRHGRRGHRDRCADRRFAVRAVRPARVRGPGRQGRRGPRPPRPVQAGSRHAGGGDAARGRADDRPRRRGEVPDRRVRPRRWIPQVDGLRPVHRRALHERRRWPARSTRRRPRSCCTTARTRTRRSSGSATSCSTRGAHRTASPARTTAGTSTTSTAGSAWGPQAW